MHSTTKVSINTLFTFKKSVSYPKYGRDFTNKYSQVIFGKDSPAAFGVLQNVDKSTISDPSTLVGASSNVCKDNPSVPA